MKTVNCIGHPGKIIDQTGKALNVEIKAPEKGKPYRVTGEYRWNGLLYYFLMGFGIKTAYRADLFTDV